MVYEVVGVCGISSFSLDLFGLVSEGRCGLKRKNLSSDSEASFQSLL